MRFFLFLILFGLLLGCTQQDVSQPEDVQVDQPSQVEQPQPTQPQEDDGEEATETPEVSSTLESEEVTYMA